MLLGVEVIRVLLPTDFSANALNAANYAIELLLPFECKFYLLHTYERPFTGGSSLPGIDEIVQKEKLKNLEDLKSKLASLFPGMRHRYECIAMNTPTEAGISQVIKDYNIDVVVMGTKGATGIKESLLGSNTAKVLQKTGCALLTIPPDYRLKSFDKIAICTDFAGINNADEFNTLRELIDNSDSSLIHLDFKTKRTVPKALAANWTKTFDNFEFSYELLSDTGPQEINSLLQEHGPDMLLMITHKEGNVDSVLRKSAAKTHGLRFQLPILIVHDN